MAGLHEAPFMKKDINSNKLFIFQVLMLTTLNDTYLNKIGIKIRVMLPPNVCCGERVNRCSPPARRFRCGKLILTKSLYGNQRFK